MHDIWTATQSDRDLQKLDAEDGTHLAGILCGALRPITLGTPDAKLSIFLQLIPQFIVGFGAAPLRFA
jgi:Tetracyclin repressor-like, C-terminal domain